MRTRPHLKLLAGSLVVSGSIVSQSGTAAANVEAGAVVGAHAFSENNELGVPDMPEAVSLRNSVIFGLRLGWFLNDMIGVEGELGFIPTEAREDVIDVFAMTYRAQLVLQLGGEDKKLIPFAVGGLGMINILSAAENSMHLEEDGDGILYAGAGVKYRLPNDFGLRFDARVIFPPSSETEFASLDGEALLSLYREWGRDKEEKIEPVIGDKDGDGLKDDVDQCIDDPEDRDGFEDEDGCPDPDNDQDTVLDDPDQCDADKEDLDAFEDENGCPEPDNDNDGILDAADACPLDPEDPDQWEDDNGCPENDNDADTIADGTDQCPTPLPDGSDTKETLNGFEDDDGCYDDVPAPVKEYTGTIKGITFKVDSDKLEKTSFKALDAAAKILQEYPSLRIEIQGHTDDTGSDEYNMDLSQRRAESVKAYLVKQGVDETRLEAKGYGRTMPVVEKTTKSARAKNRRVEFVLIK